MDKTIAVALTGQANRYQLTEDAYGRLARYLERAAARLRDDPDHAEVLGDLERSVGDKLAALLGSNDRVVTTADIDAVLEEIGAVETGQDSESHQDADGAESAEGARQPRKQIGRAHV